MFSTKNTFLAFGIVAFMFMTLFGMFQPAMNMSMGGDMSSHCPFMTGMNLCPMTPLEHVSYMQSFFTSIPQQENPFLVLLLALSFIAVFGLPWLRNLFSPPNSSSRSFQYFYRQRSRSIPNVLQELFSQGILNPKSF